MFVKSGCTGWDSSVIVSLQTKMSERMNAVIFNVSVSCAAQYMIYSASKVFELCEQRLTDMPCPLGWKKWMAGFKEAQTNLLIDPSGKKYAKLAVAAMTEAELGEPNLQAYFKFEEQFYYV